MAKGTVTVKIEVFNEDGKRTNIECFSLSQKAFLDPTGEEHYKNLYQAIARTRKEILTPTPKTDMA